MSISPQADRLAAAGAELIEAGRIIEESQQRATIVFSSAALSAVHGNPQHSVALPPSLLSTDGAELLDSDNAYCQLVYKK